ncbi:SLBB domain-containing protein, partial [Bacteroides sp. OttesenSCG-928-D19]|nr:SLBB domain-containing protein [Bacteroides sp. OttesenSCG-928-D19]
TIRQVISPEGSILVKNIGPIYLSGKTMQEATNYLQREFSKIYSGMSDNASQITLTLGQNRTIQINIMGEVKVPGTYRLSSFATVFHALYSAGGVNKIGGIRDIRVVRGGKVIANIDVYEYIMDGRTSLDIRLVEDDVILVSPYESLVSIAGNVKRPMYYEMKKGETISALLEYAGGFTGDAYSDNIRLIRLSSGHEKQIFSIDATEYSRFVLADGDQLVIEAVLERFENMVEVSGAVFRGGMYQLNGDVNTVRGLIKKAEGLRGDAYLDRVQIQRQRDDLTLELIPVNLRGILDGVQPDIPLVKNDILYIPSIHDLNQNRVLTIHGEVANPGSFIYADNMTVSDLIIQAGGLLERASTAKVDVARRIKDPKSTEPRNEVGEMFSFELKDGSVIGEGNDFYLEPFDEVYIRKSPVYHTLHNVAVRGEVAFGGSYALSRKNERVSDLVNRAGGITKDAYVKGARLIRKMTDEEVRRKRDAIQLARSADDESIPLGSLDLSSVYSVGIDLDAALKNPGTDLDLVLIEGDVLLIPEYSNTVKINGAVMYPNTVVYNPNGNLKYYINQAGGFTNQAKKRRAYVVYMNGTVARLKSGTVNAIEPGCEIIIPSKEEKRRMTTGEIISVGTSIASLAMMVATLVNVIKK